MKFNNCFSCAKKVTQCFGGEFPFLNVGMSLYQQLPLQTLILSKKLKYRADRAAGYLNLRTFLKPKFSHISAKKFAQQKTIFPPGSLKLHICLVAQFEVSHNRLCSCLLG